MEKNNTLIIPNQTEPETPAGFFRKSWVMFVLGFLGWFILSLPLINNPNYLLRAHATTSLVIVAVLLILKRTRLIGVGMACAIIINFLVSTLLGTIISPRELAPIVHPDIYRNRWNFTFHYVSKNNTREAIHDCLIQEASVDETTTVSTPRLIAFESDRDGNNEIYLMNADGSELKNLTNHLDYDGLPAWSPDGKQLAFMSLRDGNMEIYLMNADGTDQKRLTENPANDYAPTWSPDGKQIAFASDRDGNTDIYRMNVDGTALTNLTQHPAQDTNPAWSPDGQQIVFSSDRENKPRDYYVRGIYVMNADGTGTQRLSENSMMGVRSFPAWSPGGNCILYNSGAYFTDWIMLLDMQGFRPVKLVHAGSHPHWSSDGRWLAYAVVHGEWNLEIYTLDLATLQTFRLTRNSAMDGRPVWKP